MFKFLGGGRSAAAEPPLRLGATRLAGWCNTAQSGSKKATHIDVEAVPRTWWLPLDSFMDNDTAVEHSARETRGTGSSSSTAEDNNDDATSSSEEALRERHRMSQAAPAATVPPALPHRELPGTPVGTLPQGSEVALQASAGSGGEAPTEPKSTTLENLKLPSEEARCDSVIDDDRSQSEATTGSVSPAPAACFSSGATPTGGGPPSPPASVAEEAASKVAPSRMFPQAGPPDNRVTLISSSSGMTFQQQQEGHHPPAEPTYSPSLAAVSPSSAAVLHGGPAAGAAAAAEEGEKNARTSSPSAKEPPSSGICAAPRHRNDSLPRSPPPEHEDQNLGQQEAAPAASAATTVSTTLEEGGGDTNILHAHAQQQQEPPQRPGGVMVGASQEDRPISDNPASTLLSASSPSYDLQQPFVQHTRQHVNEPHQPTAVLHPGGAAANMVAAAATTSTHGQFPEGGLQPTFGNHNAYAQPPPPAAAAAYYGHHQPTQYSAGGPTPTPPPGTMLGGAGLPYHSHHSGFNLPDTGRAPLLSAPPPAGGGVDRYELVHPGAVYNQYHEHQHLYQPQQALHPPQHQQQQQFEFGKPDALASAATATLAEHHHPEATAGAPLSNSSGAANGGIRGRAPAAAVLGTAAGVMAAAAGRADGDTVQNNAYNDIGLVVTRTKELEKIMRDSFHATGEKGMYCRRNIWGAASTRQRSAACVETIHINH